MLTETSRPIWCVFDAWRTRSATSARMRSRTALPSSSLVSCTRGPVVIVSNVIGSRPPRPCRTGRRNLPLELPAAGGERCQPLQFEAGAGAEEIDPLGRQDGPVDVVASPIGNAAVVVG